MSVTDEEIETAVEDVKELANERFHKRTWSQEDSVSAWKDLRSECDFWINQITSEMPR